MLALFYTWPIFRHPTYWGVGDWDLHSFYRDVTRRTIVEYGQVPLWNPYYCGGTVQLANPENSASPSLVLVLLFGTEVGIKLEILLHLIIGLRGTHLLARHLGLAAAARWMATVTFLLSGLYVRNLAVGMSWFMSVAYVPWVFLCSSKAVEDSRFIWGAALALALIVWSGGAYVFVITSLFLLLDAMLQAIERRQPRPLTVIATIGALGATWSAGKLLPVLHFLWRHPREVSDYSGFSLASFRDALLVRDPRFYPGMDDLHGFVHGTSYETDENGMYVGVIPLLLAMFGMASSSKSRFRLLICFVVFTWISFGDRAAPLSVWQVLHLVPVFRFMRVAQRFRIIAMLCLSLFAGFGLDRLATWARIRFGPGVARRLSWGLLIFVTADLLYVNHSPFEIAFPRPPLLVARQSTFRQELDWWMSPRGSHLAASRTNAGLIRCYTSLPIEPGAVASGKPAYEGEVFVVGRAGEASFDVWTPNLMLIRGRVPSGGYIAVNQNFDVDWRATGAKGRELAVVNGGSVGPQYANRILLQVSSEDREILLRYAPASFVVGVASTLLTTLAAILWFVRERRRHASDGRRGLRRRV